MRMKLLQMRAQLWKRALDATHDVPLPWMLDALRVVSYAVPQRVSDWVEPAIRHLGLEGRAARDYARRAWWAAQASKAVRARLQRRPHEVMAALGGDASAVHEARKRGGLLVLGAHMGPAWIAASWLRDQYPETLFLIGVDWAGSGTARVARVGQDDLRSGPLVQAVRELKRGGVVYIAPDAPIGALTYELPLRGHLLPMAAGAPALARLAQVPSIPLAAAWYGDDVRLLCGEVIEAPSDTDGERAWLGRYLEVIDRWQTALGPENLKAQASLVVALGLRGRRM